MSDEPATTTPDAPTTPEPTGETAVAEGEKKKVKQTVEIKDIGPCKKHIKVIVDRAGIDENLEKKYKELVGDSWIPGFRPGRAPRQIVTRKYKKEVYDQVKGEILLSSLEQLAEDHDVAPLAPPNLNPTSINIPEKGDFIYEFDVEVRPHFDLPRDPLQALREAPFIRFDRETWTGLLVRDVLSRSRAEVRDEMELNSVEAILAIVRQGFGVSIVPKLANVRWSEDRELRVVELPNVDVRRRVGLLERSRHARMRFTAAIKRYFADAGRHARGRAR